MPPLFAALNGTSASYEYARDTESRLRNDQEKSYIALQRSIDGLAESLKELKTELKTDIKELKTELKELDKKFMKAASGFFLALITVGLSSQPDLREWAQSIFAAFK